MLIAFSPRSLSDARLDRCDASSLRDTVWNDTSYSKCQSAEWIIPLWDSGLVADCLGYPWPINGYGTAVYVQVRPAKASNQRVNRADETVHGKHPLCLWKQQANHKRRTKARNLT